MINGRSFTVNALALLVTFLIYSFAGLSGLIIFIVAGLVFDFIYKRATGKSISDNS